MGIPPAQSRGFGGLLSALDALLTRGEYPDDGTAGRRADPASVERCLTKRGDVPSDVVSIGSDVMRRSAAAAVMAVLDFNQTAGKVTNKVGRLDYRLDWQ